MSPSDLEVRNHYEQSHSCLKTGEYFGIHFATVCNKVRKAGGQILRPIWQRPQPSGVVIRCNDCGLTNCSPTKGNIVAQTNVGLLVAHAEHALF